MFDELLSAVGVKDISEIGEMLVQVVGRHVVLITNMQGVLLLSENEIQVKASKHQKAIIKGDFLEVSAMNKNDITISGRIFSVEFEGI
ncbi:MAG: YabP/YqfC family sporulation protein [Clostridia bacterium]|nr:YabP/YqfC family sporulation protein [Clostridia bacterium]